MQQAEQLSKDYQIIADMVDALTYAMECEGGTPVGIAKEVRAAKQELWVRAKAAGMSYCNSLESGTDPWRQKDERLVSDLLAAMMSREERGMINRSSCQQLCDKADELLNCYCVVDRLDGGRYSRSQILFTDQNLENVIEYCENHDRSYFYDDCLNVEVLQEKINLGSVAVVDRFGVVYRLDDLAALFDQEKKRLADLQQSLSVTQATPEPEVSVKIAGCIASINALFDAVKRGEVAPEEFADGGTFAEVGNRMRAMLAGIDGGPSPSTLRF